MKDLYYSPIDIAAILQSLDLGAREEVELLERIWLYERAFLTASYRDDKRKLILDVRYWQHYLHDKIAIDAEFPAIQKDILSMGGAVDKTQYISETMDLDLFFKSMRIRILFIGQKDYARIKLRTLLKTYGYKRRSDKLLAYMERCLTFFHLEPYLHGELCDISGISLNDMISFRIS